MPTRRFCLTSHLKYVYSVVINKMRRTYITQQVADAIGVSKRTLLRWLYGGKLEEPRRIRFDGQSYRIWSERGLQAARKHKMRFYMKGRGRKKRGK